MRSPCTKDCPDRILPTRDNPTTCHGHCPREAEYLAFKEAKSQYYREKCRIENDVQKVWSGKGKRIRRNKR